MDLLIDTQEPNDFAKKGMLRDQLENDTRIPYRVDLVFRDQISQEFYEGIEKERRTW